MDTRSHLYDGLRQPLPGGGSRAPGQGGFWLEATPVTNRKFTEFVKATGYVTLAEKAPDPKDHPGALPKMLKAGSLVFTPPKAVNGSDINQWWNFKFGANWRRPYGGLSDLRGKLDHPVVHVAHCDARAHAEWADLDLPTEAEWELAARGGLDDTEFVWGEELVPGGTPMANTWTGTFPTHNTKPAGKDRTSPVRSFPANGYGAYDMIGNVWEWTMDYWSTRHPEPAAKSCCIPQNPRGLRSTEATIRVSLKSASRAGSLRAGPISAPPTTAAATVRRPPCGARGYVHQPRRLPLHQANQHLIGEPQ
jgi:formylglycine-generating enzyme required for sulfatase activity